MPAIARIAVHQPEVTYLAGLDSAGLENVPPMDDVKGRVSGSKAKMVCKLTGLYTGSAYFAEVDAKGSFRFPYIPVGDYLFCCMSERRVFGLRVVRVVPGSTPTIRVSASDTAGSGSEQ